MILELFLLACALVLFVVALWLRRRTGIPWAPIRYSDTNAFQRVEQPLVSHRYGLVGRPDYVLQTRAGLIPVEIKPSRTATEPYESDLAQLAAYCLLIEETTGRAPRYGLLRYAYQTFRMPYTADLRAYVLDILQEMRSAQTTLNVARSHMQPGRCSACHFFEICEDRLEE